MKKYSSKRPVGRQTRPNQAALKPVKRQLTLTIHDLSFDGQGIARLGRDVYFVPGALIDEEVEVTVTGRSKKIWRCELKKIITQSPNRVTAPCQYYQRCGGCDLQHLDYPGQLEFKQQRVAKELSRQGIEVAQQDWQTPIKDQAWQYRRRARIGIRYNKQKQQFFIGFREAQKQHLINIEQCPVLIEHPALTLQDWHARLAQLEGKERVTHIEVLQADNRLALVFRVLNGLTEHDKALFVDWATELEVDIYQRDDQHQLQAINSVVALHHTVQDHQQNSYQLDITADYFLQVNQSVNLQMIERALSWLEPKEGQHIWDLFAGHGNFSIPLANYCQVSALEVSDVMVKALQAQAESLNQKSEHLRPIKADLTDSQVLDQLSLPDAVLLDPPRAGAMEILPSLVKSQVAKIVYVSCDPATLARDLKVLQAGGYQVAKACILDMFPQTHHVETMVLLEKA